MKIVSFYDVAPEGDPFVTNGVVSKWRLLEWNAAFI